MADTRKNEKIKALKKYRRYAAIITAAALVVALNIFAGTADSKFNLSLDVTKEQYSTLTDNSKAIIGSLNKNIYLYYIGESEQQDIITTQLLKSYSSASKKVHYSIIDPVYYTQAISGFKGASDGSVIVSDTDIFSGAQIGTYTVLTAGDMYSGSVIDPKSAGPSGRILFSGEQKITSAIEYIEGGTVDRAVFLIGEEEEKPCDSLLADLSGRFYKTDFQAADSPLDPSTDTIIAVSPKEDLSGSAYSNIKAFLDSGGHAMFFISSINVNDVTGEAEYPEKLANFDALLAEYGAGVDPDIIIGGDPSKTYKFPADIIPNLSPVGASKIAVDPNIRPVIEYMSPINLSNTSGVSVTPLLETDASCYSEPINTVLSGTKMDTSDLSGPFTVGAILEKGDSSLALFTSSSFVVSEDDYSYQGNSELFLNTLSFLGHRMGSVSIPVKTIYSFRDPSYRIINVSGILKAFIILIVVCALPLIPLLAGLYRTAKRKRA